MFSVAQDTSHSDLLHHIKREVEIEAFTTDEEEEKRATEVTTFALPADRDTTILLSAVLKV
jgi:hypothetical protein